MSQNFTMTCPHCGEEYSSRQWGNAGAPQQCPKCGTQMRLEWFGDEDPEYDRGRNGVNFGQDW